jgi:hypothetical protein
MAKSHIGLVKYGDFTVFEPRTNFGGTGMIMMGSQISPVLKNFQRQR